MNREEQVSAVLEEARNYGLRLQFDCGLLIVKRTKSGDSEKQDAIIAELAKRLADVRRLVERRASGARAKDFLGRRIWATEQGPGTLTDAADDGTLSISIGAEMRRYGEDDSRRSQLSISSNSQSLLIVVDDEGADETSSAEQKHELEVPRKRVLGIF